MHFAKANCNGKIWLFVKEGYQVDIVVYSTQQIMLKIHDTHLDKAFHIIGGDLNMVLNEEEKINGNPVHPDDTEELANCTRSGNLIEVYYKCSSFNWWNGRAAEDCIFERLD
ncbi:hypothetical protein H5410_062058 [Solanum commersonii]|uniref:Uncharacterized protein n=1 Tax=Solanum commersonii TaxID=4109 RepID=A0A9J5WAI8_SOLCO|nr:hypothetical protein H5410_062058 [Solanum commersonii]